MLTGEPTSADVVALNACQLLLIPQDIFSTFLAVNPDALKVMAKAITELSRAIPGEIDWALQVDGHTDVRPINSPEFPSNWELSTARAISVVRYLISRGVPAQRLVAAGYGEFQPLDRGTSEEALRRNRRIELKLTNR